MSLPPRTSLPPAARAECTFRFGLTLTADDIENTLLERVASRLRPEDVAHMTHKLLLHMILDVHTLKLVNVQELMEEAQMSEYHAQALLIPREEDWNAWRRTSGVAGGAGPGAGSLERAAVPHPDGAAPSGGAAVAEAPPHPPATKKSVYDVDFILRLRNPSHAAAHAQRVQGQVKAVMSHVDAAQSPAPQAIPTIRFGGNVPTIHFGSGGGQRGGRGERDRKGTTRAAEPLGDVQPLQRSENAFDPRANRARTSSDMVLKEARALLNKLTMTNFDRLVPQLASLNITAPEELTKVVTIIFDKALEEGHFCNM